MVSEGLSHSNWVPLFLGLEGDQRGFMVEKKQSKEHVGKDPDSYTPLRAHETPDHLV